MGLSQDCVPLHGMQGEDGQERVLGVPCVPAAILEVFILREEQTNKVSCKGPHPLSCSRLSRGGGEQGGCEVGGWGGGWGLGG